MVEWDLLAKKLASGGKSCARPLLLSNCTEKTTAGLGSFLYISCGEEDCGELNLWLTNKTHHKTARGRPVPQSSFFVFLLFFLKGENKALLAHT